MDLTQLSILKVTHIKVTHQGQAPRSHSKVKHTKVRAGVMGSKVNLTCRSFPCRRSNFKVTQQGQPTRSTRSNTRLNIWSNIHVKFKVNKIWYQSYTCTHPIDTHSHTHTHALTATTAVSQFGPSLSMS